jgi:hypothetical protein
MSQVSDTETRTAETGRWTIQRLELRAPRPRTSEHTGATPRLYDRLGSAAWAASAKDSSRASSTAFFVAFSAFRGDGKNKKSRRYLCFFACRRFGLSQCECLDAIIGTSVRSARRNENRRHIPLQMRADRKKRRGQSLASGTGLSHGGETHLCLLP